MPTDLTPTDKLVIMNLDQDEFLGFSYTNPEYVAPAIQHRYPSEEENVTEQTLGLKITVILCVHFVNVDVASHFGLQTEGSERAKQVQFSTVDLTAGVGQIDLYGNNP